MELVRLGYLRGIQKRLDTIAAAHPASAGVVGQWRAWASAFQLDTLADQLQAALQHPDLAPAPLEKP